MKKVLLVMLLALAVVPMASAGVIDILFAGGTWSWSGGLGSQLNATSTSVQINGNPLVLGLTITSGGAIGGNGTGGSPYLWGVGGNLTLAGCGGPCFSGSFTNAQLGLNGSGGMTFVGNFLGGSVNPAFLAFLGLPTTPTQYYGLMHMDISPTPVSFATGGSGTVGSGDIHISNVPEPGTLAMFGTGLIGLAGLLRRKFNL